MIQALDPLHSISQSDARARGAVVTVGRDVVKLNLRPSVLRSFAVLGREIFRRRPLTLAWSPEMPRQRRLDWRRRPSRAIVIRVELAHILRLPVSGGPLRRLVLVLAAAHSILLGLQTALHLLASMGLEYLPMLLLPRELARHTLTDTVHATLLDLMTLLCWAGS